MSSKKKPAANVLEERCKNQGTKQTAVLGTASLRQSIYTAWALYFALKTSSVHWHGSKCPKLPKKNANKQQKMIIVYTRW